MWSSVSCCVVERKSLEANLPEAQPDVLADTCSKIERRDSVQSRHVRVESGKENVWYSWDILLSLLSLFLAVSASTIGMPRSVIIVCVLVFSSVSVCRRLWLSADHQHVPSISPTLTTDGGAEPTVRSISAGLLDLEQKWSARVAACPVVESSLQTQRRPSCTQTGVLRIVWGVEGSAPYSAELRRITRSDLMRFLLARRGDVSKALMLAERVVTWRAAVCPAMVTLSQIPNAIAQGVWRFAGWTKCGYPILACDASVWAPSKYADIDEYIRYLGYLMELLVQTRMGPGIEKFVVLFELQGFSFEMVRPIAMRCIVNMTQIVQENNAERCAAIYMCNSNLAFRMSWHLMAPLADDRTRQKIHWPLPAETGSILGQYVDAAVLERRFGGNFQGTYVPLVGRWDHDAETQAPPSFDASAPDPLHPGAF